MHSKSVDSLSLTRAGFIEYFLVATKLVHALTAIAPALFLLYYPGLVPVELRSNMLGLLLFFGALTVIMFQALDVYSDDIFSNRLRFRIMFFAWASAFCLLLFMYQGLGLFPYLSSKLVIFWFTGSLLLFGVQRLLVLRLYRAWMKRGMYLQRTVILGFTVAPLDDPLRQRAVCPPWGCPRTAMHQPHQRLRFEAGFLPRALREQDIDLYISTFNMGLPLPPRPPGVRYALLIHDLFQITLKNYHANRLKALVYRVSDYLSIAYALRVADRVWTPSQYSADEAVRLFPGVAGKVRVLPNQVDGFAGEPADLSARGLPPRYWLLVGTRELRKNVPWFVSAWTRARAQAPGVPPLVLVGSLDHLPEEQRGLPGLHALGGLDDAELHALYRQAERLWQPSYAEGFGLPVVEALSVGTPVAVASGTSLDEVTPPSAPRFSPSDGAALERLMLRLADTPREASAEELIAWAARFNREAYRQRLAALIEELS